VAAALLDRGFATPKNAEGTGERLPEPRVKPYEPPLSSTLVAAGKSAPKPGSTVKGTNGGGEWGRPALLLALGSAATSAGLRRRTRRRRRARADRLRQQAEMRRRELLRLTDPEGWDAGGRVQTPGQYEAL
jgi:hypothetical protein